MKSLRLSGKDRHMPLKGIQPHQFLSSPYWIASPPWNEQFLLTWTCTRMYCWTRDTKQQSHELILPTLQTQMSLFVNIPVVFYLTSIRILTKICWINRFFSFHIIVQSKIIVIFAIINNNYFTFTFFHWAKICGFTVGGFFGDIPLRKHFCW